jgi:succinoglycan biosynthesis transport protein ExoP
MPADSRSLLLRIPVVFLAMFLGALLAERGTAPFRQIYSSMAVLQMQALVVDRSPAAFEAVQRELAGKSNLEAALRSLNMEASDAAVQRLHRSVRVRELRETRLVGIAVTSTNPQTAAETANAIAAEFVSRKFAEQQAATAQALAKLEAEVTEHRQKVQALRQACDEIRTREGITDLRPDKLGDEGKSLPDAIAELKAQIATERALQEKMAALSDAQILEEIATGSPWGKSLDPTLNTLSAELKDVAAAEQKRAEGYGPEDPRLLAIRARKADLEKQLSQLVQVLRKRVETQLSANEAKLQMAEHLGRQAHPSAEAIAQYREAKQLHLQGRKTLEELERKLSAEKIEYAMPRSPATIWEKAEPPSQPDFWLTSQRLLGLILGLAVGIGLATLPRPGVTVGILLLLAAAALAYSLITTQKL